MKAQPGRWFRAGLVRAAFAVGIWWALNEGEVPYPLAMLGFVAAATVASLWLRPPGGSLRPAAVVRVAVFLLRHGASASFDVAVRALRPSLPVRPGFLHHPFALPPGGARNFFVGAVNLMPGTASVRIEEDLLVLHVLVRDDPRTVPTLLELEALLADVVR